MSLDHPPGFITKHHWTIARFYHHKTSLGLLCQVLSSKHRWAYFARFYIITGQPASFKPRHWTTRQFQITFITGLILPVSNLITNFAYRHLPIFSFPKITMA
jgi:hypothetical protein